VLDHLVFVGVLSSISVCETSSCISEFCLPWSGCIVI